MSDHRPNSWDVADEAGVSQSTVSRALRRDPSVSDATRIRVLEAARRLKYVVNANAAVLRKGRSRTLGLIVLYNGRSGLGRLNPFYTDLQKQIVLAGSRRGFSVIVQYETGDRQQNSLYDSAICEGFIVIGSARHEQCWKNFHDLSTAGVPVVAWGIQSNSLTALCSANRQAATKACEHLISLGRERITCITPEPKARSQFLDRIQGYSHAMQHAGRETVFIEINGEQCDPTDSQFRKLIVDRLRQGASMPDAIFATQDILAIGCMQALISEGYAIPDDIAICGFDDIEASSLVYPRLTSVRQDLPLIAERLVANAEALFLGTSVDTRPISAKLEIRDSTVGTVVFS